MSSIMPWMVDMLEYMKTALISRMNEDAANKERLEELVSIAHADNMNLRLDIEENTIALVKSLVGDIFYRVKLKSQYEHDLASITSSYDSKMATQKAEFDSYMALELVKVVAEYDAKLASDRARASVAFDERLHAQLAIVSNQYEEKACIAHKSFEVKLTRCINAYNESERKAKEWKTMYIKLLDDNKRRDKDGNAVCLQAPRISPGIENGVHEESGSPLTHEVGPIASNLERCEDVDRGHVRHLSSSSTPPSQARIMLPPQTRRRRD